MLSRKYLVFKAKEDCQLTYNYQYPLSVILYKKMELRDSEFSNMLHNEGFRSKDAKRKKMKLFNFNLIFHNLDMVSTGIKFNKGDEVRLCISGHKKIINTILQGFTLNNHLAIYDCDFEFAGLENDDKRVKFNDVNIYKSLSPMIESIWDKEVIFLTPYQKEYYDAIKQNLRRKYELIYDKEYKGEIKIMIEDMLDIKPKTIAIKGGYLQGYSKFNVLVQCDADMQKIVYYCGLGQNNSLGAGFVKFITGGKCNGESI